MTDKEYFNGKNALTRTSLARIITSAKYLSYILIPFIRRFKFMIKYIRQIYYFIRFKYFNKLPPAKYFKADKGVYEFKLTKEEKRDYKALITELNKIANDLQGGYNHK